MKTFENLAIFFENTKKAYENVFEKKPTKYLIAYLNGERLYLHLENEAEENILNVKQEIKEENFKQTPLFYLFEFLGLNLNVWNISNLNLKPIEEFYELFEKGQRKLKDLCEKLELTEEEFFKLKKLIVLNCSIITDGNLQKDIERITDNKLKEKFLKALKIIEEGEENDTIFM